MYATLVRRSQDVSKSLLRLLPGELPPALKPTSGHLYEILSRKPNVNGMEVYQKRWTNAAPDSYWKVSHARFKDEGRHGKAWGILYWKGRKMNNQPKLIRGALKYEWKEGRSLAMGSAARKPTNKS